MEKFRSTDKFIIRGNPVFVVDSAPEYLLIGDHAEIDGVVYKIIGIERFKGLNPSKNAGLMVSEVLSGLPTNYN
jgi:hypothetical protein